jgi:hypothetical protein
MIGQPQQQQQQRPLNYGERKKRTHDDNPKIQSTAAEGKVNISHKGDPSYISPERLKALMEEMAALKNEYPITDVGSDL